MPIVANTALPSFERYQREGGDVLALARARSQDVRELHVGLMNNMPDAALEPTERQFLRLIGDCNGIIQFFVYPFSFSEIPRNDKARAHIRRYYFDFEELKEAGLDALIISGANPVCARLSDESFWDPLCRVLDWAKESVTSTLCACLATHAALNYFHAIERQPLISKRWGVFSNRVSRVHPLVRDVNSRFDVPHSRWNEIYSKQMIDAGLLVLVESEEAGVHLATSHDGLRFIYFQGHPEYDHNSLLKEYKREVNRYLVGDINDYPPYPDHYFSAKSLQLLQGYRKTVEVRRESKLDLDVDDFPETDIEVDNTWGDTGRVVFNNWLGAVYQITSRDRRKPFMAGVNPEQPLGSKF